MVREKGDDFVNEVSVEIISSYTFLKSEQTKNRINVFYKC